MASQLRIGAPAPILRRAAPAAGLATAAAGELTPGQIAAQVNHYKTTLPAPLTDAQIQTRAQGELDPLVKRVTDAINARATNAATAIGGYTGALAHDLERTDFGAPYVGAEAKQAAVDASLAQAASGGGTSLAADLSTRLAAIGEPGVVDAAAGAVSGTGAANAATTVAGGGANLGALIANEAASRAYGIKLPGIARLAGAQDIAGANQQAQTDIGTQTTSILNQLPSIVNDLRTQSATNAANRAQLGERVSEFLTNRNTTVAGQQTAETKNQIGTILSLGVDPATGTLTAAAAEALGKLTGIDPAALTGTDATAATSMINATARAGASSASKPKIIGSSSTGYYAYDPSTGATTEVIKPAAKGVKVAAPKIVGSDKTGRYAYDPNTGKKTLIVPPVTAAAAAKGGQKLPTANEISHLIDGWKNGKLTTVHENGTTTSALAGQLSFGQSYKRLRAMGLSDVSARQYLDSAYKRGEQGRAWLTNEEQSVLGRAKLPAQASVMNGHGVLRPAQVKALRAAGRLPQGQLTAEGAYVIAQVA